MPTESLVFSVSIDQQNQVLPILLGITNVQYPKAKEPMWWTVHPNSFSLISEDWDDRLFQLAERDEKNYGETGVLGKSQGTQKYKGRSRGHLHLRGPSCVFLIFYPTEKKKKKKADCTFFVVRKGKTAFAFNFKGMFTKGGLSQEQS